MNGARNAAEVEVAVTDARFEDLSGLVLSLTPPEAARLLLYVEFDDGVIGPSLFYELDSELRYVETVDPLFDELARLQSLFGPDVRAMELQISDDSFLTNFTYNDSFNEDSGRLSREDAILAKHYGHANVAT